jgi:HNH endonuclease
MWRWERGRLPYFQFDVLRRIAVFATHQDWKRVGFADAELAVGLRFDPQRADYLPWRNYQRLFRTALLVSVQNDIAQPTSLAAALAIPGRMTSDEYFHSLAQSHTDPSVAASAWNAHQQPRFPLLFSLRYLLTKAKVTPPAIASFDEVIGAYTCSGFCGDETQDQFISLLDREAEFEATSLAGNSDYRRESRESLLVLLQISYLSAERQTVSVNLHPDDALDAFEQLKPLAEPFLADREAEVRRRADLYADGSALAFLDFPRTVISETDEAGFSEGSRVTKTHLVIERNAQLRRLFMQRFNPQMCDVCRLQTARTYPWTQGVIDIHHKLPLASGTRSDTEGTVLDDLVAVCPSCHRAVHRFYDRWLKTRNRSDFESIEEANEAYNTMKIEFPGAIHAA